MRERIERLFALLAEQGTPAEGVLITSPENVFYYCGFWYEDGYLFLTQDRCVLFTDFRYREAAEAQVGEPFRVEMITALRGKQLKETAASLSVGTLAYENTKMSCASFAYWQEQVTGVEWIPLGQTILMQRSKKEEREIDIIRCAQRIAEAALEETLPLLKMEMTEIEVAAELEYRMRRHGAQGVAFQTIAVCADGSALPHGVPRNQKLQKGFLTMDFGARYQGYCSDMTRTVHLGLATEEEKRVYETVRIAQLAAISKIELGADCGMIHSVASKIIDGAGYAGCFGHGLGHGVGLDVHEAPRLSPSGTGTRLEVGHVVTVEPGIYLARQYGVRIEDMIAMHQDGAENLALAPKEWMEI